MFKLAVAGSLMCFSVSKDVCVCMLNVIHLSFFSFLLFFPSFLPFVQFLPCIFMSLRLFSALYIFRKPFTRFIIDTRCAHSRYLPQLEQNNWQCTCCRNEFRWLPLFPSTLFFFLGSQNDSLRSFQGRKNIESLRNFFACEALLSLLIYLDHSMTVFSSLNDCHDFAYVLDIYFGIIYLKINRIFVAISITI